MVLGDFLNRREDVDFFPWYRYQNGGVICLRGCIEGCNSILVVVRLYLVVHRDETAFRMKNERERERGWILETDNEFSRVMHVIR